MSVNNNSTNLNENVANYLLGGGAANPVASISSITSDRIVLDGVNLDGSTSGGGQLLINGVAVATVNQNVSSIGNWALYPALSTITYATGGGSGGALIMNTGSLSSLTVSSINGLPPGGGGVSSLTTWAQLPAISTISFASGGGLIQMNTGNFSTLNVSSINNLNTQGAVVVDGGSYTSGGNKTIPVSTNYALVSTANSYTFTAGHQYTVTAPSSYSIVSQTGTGLMSVGIEPLSNVTTGNLNIYRASATNYLNGQTSAAFNQVLNGTYYSPSTLTSPLGMWCYLFPGGPSALTIAASLNQGGSDVLVVQDLGLATQI